MSRTRKTSALDSLLTRLDTLVHFVEGFPNRVKVINEMVEACSQEMTDMDICEVYDTLDVCILGLEEIVTQHCDPLKAAHRLLEKRAMSSVEQQKKAVKMWTIAKSREDIAEELLPDRKSIEEPRFITTPRHRSKRVKGTDT